VVLVVLVVEELEEILLVLDPEDEVVLIAFKGICARNVAMGFIAKMSDAVLQQAKLPMPLPPGSQQLC